MLATRKDASRGTPTPLEGWLGGTCGGTSISKKLGLAPGVHGNS
jgi:hypothetical protein